MSGLREPAVAGLFYPAAAAQLEQDVHGLLAAAGTMSDSQDGRVPKAIVVPHAGYVYSGPIAARAYAASACLEGQVRRIVLIGPAHFVYFRGIAAPRVSAFETPLGPFDLDRDVIDEIAALPCVVLSDAPHEREHCLEVQLPFIQLTLGKVPLVPLVVGDTRTENVADLLDRLWDGPETLIVVSSDLSHYLSYDEARRLDGATASAIEALDGSRLGPQEACGYCALAGLLSTARRRGLAVERLDLRNSGDTAGPRDQVVGYGAWVLRPSTD